MPDKYKRASIYITLPDGTKKQLIFTGKTKKEADAKKAKAKADIAAALQAAGQQEAPDSPLGEEFDLRRAVIYSEILKPKFEEP